jgi:hypothetical protein
MTRVTRCLALEHPPQRASCTLRGLSQNGVVVRGGSASRWNPRHRARDRLPREPTPAGRGGCAFRRFPGDRFTNPMLEVARCVGVPHFRRSRAYSSPLRASLPAERCRPNPKPVRSRRLRRSFSSSWHLPLSKISGLYSCALSFEKKRMTTTTRAGMAPLAAASSAPPPPSVRISARGVLKPLAPAPRRRRVVLPSQRASGVSASASSAPEWQAGAHTRSHLRST